MLTLVGPLISTLRIPEGTTNVLKEIYQQNHHMLLFRLKLWFYHEMLPNAKIGPAQIFLMYIQQLVSQKIILAAQNTMQSETGYI